MQFTVTALTAACTDLEVMLYTVYILKNGVAFQKFTVECQMGKCKIVTRGQNDRVQESYSHQDQTVALKQ